MTDKSEVTEVIKELRFANGHESTVQKLTDGLLNNQKEVAKYRIDKEVEQLSQSEQGRKLWTIREILSSEFISYKKLFILLVFIALMFNSANLANYLTEKLYVDAKIHPRQGLNNDRN